MKKILVLISVAVGIVLGIFFSMISLKFAAPTTLFKEVQVNYDFDKTINLLTNSINAKEGWEVIEVIDQREKLLSHAPNMNKISIVKFYNKEYSAKMLSNDDTKVMAIQMPHSIAVYEKSDGRVMMGFSNGYVMSRLFAGTHRGEVFELIVKDMEEILHFIHYRNSTL